MEIIVCVKQVPDTTNVAMDPETGALLRSGVDSKINVYDLYALACAFKLRDEVGGRVVALSMGPPQAQAVIREAIMLGADDGYLISDRAFAGADVLATSYALAGAVRAIGGADVIICGKQTTDGDTAQVGPALAEHLGLPHVANVTAIDGASKEKLTMTQELADSFLSVEVAAPCLLTVEKGNFAPGLPSYIRKRETAGKTVRMLSLSELPDKDGTHYGADGSPTRVERIFPPAVNDEKVWVESEAAQAASEIMSVLSREKFI